MAFRHPPCGLHSSVRYLDVVSRPSAPAYDQTSYIVRYVDSGTIARCSPTTAYRIPVFHSIWSREQAVGLAAAFAALSIGSIIAPQV